MYIDHAMSWKLLDVSSSSSRRNWSIPDHLRKNPKSERFSRPLMINFVDPDALISYIDASISSEEYVHSNNLLLAEFPTFIDVLTSLDHSCGHINGNTTSLLNISLDQRKSMGDLQSVPHLYGLPLACQIEEIRRENGIEKDTINIEKIKQASGVLKYSVKIQEKKENGILNDDVNDEKKQENGRLEDVKIKETYEKYMLEDGAYIEEKIQDSVKIEEKHDIGKSKNGVNIKENQQKDVRIEGNRQKGTLKDVITSEYDARGADEAYRSACSALSEGDAELALSLLQVASLKCPPDRHIALGKVQRLIVTAMQLLEKKSTDLTALSLDKDDS